MKNYVQPGNTLTLTAPYAVTSGDGLLVGSVFGVATGDAANGAAGCVSKVVEIRRRRPPSGLSCA